MKPMAFFSLLSLLMMSLHHVTGFEVFAFLLKTETSVWSKLPWQRITTVCLAGWSAGVYKHIHLSNLRQFHCMQTFQFFKRVYT